MEERVVKFNYIVLTLCYMFGFYYVVQGLLFRSQKFNLLRLPIVIMGPLHKVFIILGVNSTVVISVGCHGMRGNLLFLALHSISSVVILTGLVAISVYLITQLRSMDDIICADMRELINTYDVEPASRYFMDIIQREGACCGIRSIDDWLPKNEVPETCVNAKFWKNFSDKSEPRILIKKISNEAELNNKSIFLTEMPSEYCYKNGCYSSYKRLTSKNVSILLIIFVINTLLLGTSIYIESFFFVETAIKEEEQCNAVIEASREEQRQIIRQRNQTSGKLFSPAPTQYNVSFENIEFTESEENIVYPKSKLRKFFQRLFAPRYIPFKRGPQRRALHCEENDGNDMVHWMYYF